MDDNPGLRSVARTNLTRLGYRVTAAPDGAEALLRAKERRFDIAVVDIIMPRREGIATIADLRLYHPDMPIIAISGGGAIDSKSLLRFAKSVGAEAVLAKPFSGRQLAALIGELISVQDSRD